MGGSGAGKTTLMDVIAGRKTQGAITGNILVNGHPKDQATWSRVMGYVEQVLQMHLFSTGAYPGCPVVGFWPHVMSASQALKPVQSLTVSHAQRRTPTAVGCCATDGHPQSDSDGLRITHLQRPLAAARRPE